MSEAKVGMPRNYKALENSRKAERKEREVSSLEPLEKPTQNTNVVHIHACRLKLT